jgi:hypothetical protein
MRSRQLPILLLFAYLFAYCRHVQRPEKPLKNLAFEHHQSVPPSAIELAGGESGIVLYENYCQFCHGSISVTTMAGRSQEAIQVAIAKVPEMVAIRLTDAELKAIAVALSNPSKDVFACEAPTSIPTVTPDLVRPLSKSEYANTLRDLFAPYNVMESLALDIAGIPSIQNKIDPFDNVRISLNDNHLFSYSNVAKKLGEALPNQAKFLQDAWGGQEACMNAEDLTRECLQTLGNSFGQRILRRPLDAVDLARALKNVGPDSNGKEELSMILYSWLMSSDFLYHLYARGTKSISDPALVELTAYELANRLAYALWSTLPDSTLLQAAADGSLKQDSVMAAQVERMLADPKARMANAEFYVQWLQLKNRSSFNLPEPLLGGLQLEESFKAEITSEAAEFVNYVTFEARGGYADLLLSPQSFAQSNTYKTIVGPSTPEQRPGLLWRLVLASSSFSSYRNLIHSGTIIRERILCEPIPPPSPQLAGDVSAATMLSLNELSSRGEVAQKTSPSSCALCHSKINPLSFAGSNRYDSVGRYIDQERRLQMDGSYKNFAINAAVEDPSIDRPGEAAVDGPYALAVAISKSQKARACLIRKRYTALMGRPAKPEAKLDGCALKRAYSALNSPAKGQLNEMMKAFIGPEFKYRRLTSP